MKLKNNVLSLDETDFGILEALQKDSRQTYTAIGKKIGIAHSTVYDRIRRMEQAEVIKNYTTIVDAEKMSVRNITAMMTVYTDPKETEKVAERLAEADETLEVYTSLSEEFLIMAKVSSPNQDELHAFIANKVAPLPGVLRIRTSIATKKLKETRFLVRSNR